MPGLLLEEFVARYVFEHDQSGLRRVEQAVKRTKDRLDKASVITFKIGSGLTAAGAGALKLFSSVEDAFAGFAARTGGDVQALRDRYQDAAERIAADTGVAVETIVMGFEKAESAGLTGAAAIAAVGDAARAEAAGIGSLAEQISLATSVTAAFGGSAKEALGIATSAAQKGEGSAADYAASLKGLVGLGSALDIEFSELAATLSATSQTAKSVPVAETQIAAFLREIASPTETAKKELKELGLTFPAVRKLIEESGLAAGIEAIMSVVDGDVDLLGRLFGSSEAQQFLLTTGPDQIRALTAAVNEASATSIATAFEQGAGSVSRVIAQLRQRAVLLGASLGERLVPMFQRLADGASRLLTWFEGLSDGVKDLIAKALAAGPVLIGLSAALKAVSFALTPISGLLNAISFSRLKDGASALTKLRGAATGLTMLRAGALVPLASSLTLAVSTVGALAAAFIVAGVLIWRHWEPIREFFAGLWDGFVQGLSPVFDALAPLAPVGRMIGEAFSFVGDAIGSLFGPVEHSAQALDSARTAGEKFGAGLAAMVEIVVFPITALVGTINWLIETVGQLWATWQQIDLAAIWTGIDFAAIGHNMVQSLIDGITSLGDSAVNAFLGILSRIRDLLPFSDARTGPLADLTASGAALPSTVAEGIAEGGPTLEVAVRAALEPLPAQIAGIEAQVTPMLNPMSGAVENIAAQVVPGIEPLVDEVAPMAAKVVPQLAGDPPAMEAITSPMEAKNLTSTLAGFQAPGITAPLPAGPSQAAFRPFDTPPAAGQALGGGTTINTGDIVMRITVPEGMNSREVGQTIATEFRDQLHVLIESSDGPFAV